MRNISPGIIVIVGFGGRLLAALSQVDSARPRFAQQLVQGFPLEIRLSL
jgi:hypothetical protein